MTTATGDDDDGVRAALAAERTRVVTWLTALDADFDAFVDASRDSNADDEHDPEGATIAFERQQVTALIDQVREHLTEIEAALARLEKGAYGRCEGCGQPIGVSRLEARPAARRCIGCATGHR